MVYILKFPNSIFCSSIGPSKKSVGRLHCCSDDRDYNAQHIVVQLVFISNYEIQFQMFRQSCILLTRIMWFYFQILLSTCRCQQYKGCNLAVINIGFKLSITNVGHAASILLVLVTGLFSNCVSFSTSVTYPHITLPVK